MTTTTANLNLRTGAGTGNPSLLVIPRGSTVTVTGDPWYPVTYNGKSGWVSGRYLSGVTASQPTPPSYDYVSDAMDIAESMLGLWYRYGGNFTEPVFKDKRGDCSGFIGFVAETMGYRPGDNKLYNYTANMMLTNFRKGVWPATKVSEADLQPMDIVFYGYTKDGEPYAPHVVYGWKDGKVIGSSGGYQGTLTDADAQRVGAKVRIDDLHFHQHPIIGIYRPVYP